MLRSLSLSDPRPRALVRQERELVVAVVSDLRSAICCHGIREEDRGLSYAEKVMQLEPESVLGLHALGWALTGLGRHEDAISALTRCVALAKRIPYFLMFLGEVLIRAGRQAEAASVIQELLERGEREPAVLGFASYLQLAAGDLETGFVSLERAGGGGMQPTPIAFISPVYDPYRQDPRFVALLRSIGYTGTALLTRGTSGVRPE